MEMTKHKPSPEQVLAILVDQHRHVCLVDPEVFPDAILTFDTTIAEWRFACDLVGWERLSLVLNEEWGMILRKDEWNTILEPANQRTLRTLCEVIAKHGKIEVMPSKSFLGGQCPSNRAFRAVRTLLLSLGVHREDIHLDTPVAPLLNQYRYKLLGPCIKLAPGALPTLEHVGRAHRIVQYVSAILLLAGIVFGLFGSRFAVLCCGLFVILIVVGTFPMFQGRIELPGVNTLGDLAERLGIAGTRNSWNKQ